MKPVCNTTSFSEDLRYDYPLNPDRRVVDLGFHNGDFSRRIAKQFNCNIDAYEPVLEWFNKGCDMGIPGLVLTHGAVGASFGKVTIKKHGAMSGAFADGEAEVSPMYQIDGVLGSLQCHLLKINVEGMEFDILERMLKMDLCEMCDNIQVQFHKCIPDAETRWKAIREGLLRTHDLTYDFPWCWENYQLKK